MFLEILGMISLSVSSVVTWFEDVLTKSGGVSFYLVMMFIVLGFRYLLSPVLGDNKNRNVGDD